AGVANEAPAAAYSATSWVHPQAKYQRAPRVISEKAVNPAMKSTRTKVAATVPRRRSSRRARAERASGRAGCGRGVATSYYLGLTHVLNVEFGVNRSLRLR